MYSIQSIIAVINNYIYIYIYLTHETSYVNKESLQRPRRSLLYKSTLFCCYYTQIKVDYIYFIIL